MSTPASGAAARRLCWPWLALAVGLLWTLLIRVPLVINARDHLDSDLAVDGLTLRDAVNGHWRWHYPGTPHMGILPLFASFPQSLIWGAGPSTLVSGGTLIWLLVVAATFWLASRAYGLSVAGCAILPLVCSSLGTIWLSGRITGGHLLTLAWHTGAFAGLAICLGRGRWPQALALGLWCGLGLYLDAMFVFTLAGLIPAAILAWIEAGRSRSGIASAGVFLLALLAGLAPLEIGRAVDPYDAYPSQFAATFQPAAIREHAGLLAFQCLPRLLAGTEIHLAEKSGPLFEAPGARLAVASGSPLQSALVGRGEWPAILLMGACFYSLFRLGRDSATTTDAARKAVGRGTLGSAFLIVIAFLVNRNIFNSDNYRYLIFVLTPWALGFGLVLNDLARRGWFAKASAGLAAVVLIEMMTSSTFLWYRDERHYVGQNGIPARLPQPAWSELKVVADERRGGMGSTAAYEMEPDVTHVFGSYWDVYKLAFLSDGRLTAIPHPMYPNRFRGWSRGLGAGRGKLLVMHPEVLGRKLGASSTAELGTGVVRSARKINWKTALKTVWVSDGRDPAELDHLEVVVP